MAHTTLLFKAEVWNVRDRVFDCVRALVDTASEAQMCKEDYYAEAVPALVNINSFAIRTCLGCAYIRIFDGGGARIFRLPMTSTPSISGGRSHDLIHAETCQQLVLIRYPIHSSTVEVQLLPQLPLSKSHHWLRSHEDVGPTGPRQAVTADGVSDLLDASAHVAVTEANVEMVLRAYNDEPFPEVAYSLDDICWASSASQEEIDKSGLVGVWPEELDGGCWGETGGTHRRGHRAHSDRRCRSCSRGGPQGEQSATDARSGHELATKGRLQPLMARLLTAVEHGVFGCR